jgi:hypothetical protein
LIINIFRLTLRKVSSSSAVEGSAAYEERILVVGKFRVYLFKAGGKVFFVIFLEEFQFEYESHIFEILEISSAHITEVNIGTI